MCLANKALTAAMMSYVSVRYSNLRRLAKTHTATEDFIGHEIQRVLLILSQLQHQKTPFFLFAGVTGKADLPAMTALRGFPPCGSIAGDYPEKRYRPC